MKSFPLKNLLVIRGSVTRIAEEIGTTRQNIEYKAKSGFMVGMVNGELSIYEPKKVERISEELVAELRFVKFEK